MAAQTTAITANLFAVTIDGTTIGRFAELQGIKTEIRVVEFVESGDKGLIQTKMPANPELAVITLKRGQDNSMEMWAWHEAARLGQLDQARKSCSLVMFDASGKPVSRFHLENAWPSKIEIGPLRAGSSEMLMESVTLVCDHLQRVAP